MDDIGAPTSVLGDRLAVSLDGRAPTLADLGLEAAKDAAFLWQEQRSRADWHEIVTLLRNPTASEWMREIHGLFGVIAELVLVGIEAEVEKAILQQRLDDMAAPAADAPRYAALSRSLRFFAEGQGNSLIVAGHGLANLALRTIALHSGFAIQPHAKALRVQAQAFTPRSRQERAWTSLTDPVVQELKIISDNLAVPELQTLVSTIHRLVTDEDWRALRALRNDQYHRWRGESPGVTGINLTEESFRARLERGESVGLGRSLLPDYKEGEAILREVVRVSRKALDVVVQAMPDIRTAWFASFRALTT